MSDKKGTKDRNPITKKFIIKLALGIIIIWLITWLLIFCFIDTPSHRGTFGDMFGSINALFSGLAFAGIIITIILQSHELKSQREELEQTREVFEQQKFDHTFFKFIDLHTNNLSKLEYIDENEGLFIGVLSIKHRLSEISDSFIGVGMDNYTKKIMANLERNDISLKHYINTIKGLLLFIVDNKSDHINKDFYKNLVVGHLSDQEKLLILLYFIGTEKKELMKLFSDSGMFGEISNHVQKEYGNAHDIYKNFTRSSRSSNS